VGLAGCAQCNRPRVPAQQKSCYKVERGIYADLIFRVEGIQVGDYKRTTNTGYRFIPWKPAVNRGRTASESKPSCIAHCNRLMDTTMRVDIGTKRPISRHHRHVTTLCYMRLQMQQTCQLSFKKKTCQHTGVIKAFSKFLDSVMHF